MVQRRTFLCWLLSGAAMPIRGVHLHAQAAALPADSIATLRAVAGTVLPSELRAAGQEKVVADFVQWLASYRSGAERSWGYGAPRQNGTATLDTSRYAAQLRAIESVARTQGSNLSALSSDARGTIVLASINEAGVRELPSAPDGRHVVSDVMSFFFHSGAASDLAYRAPIRRGTCRGLAGATAKPALAGD
jgi:hypothetical protein